MAIFDLKNEEIQRLFKNHDVSIELFGELLQVVSKSGSQFYNHSGEKRSIYEKLTMGEMSFQASTIPAKDKKDWKNIRDLKTGDRGYINRFLITELKKNYSDIYSQVLEPIISDTYKNNSELSLDLCDEVYVLYLIKDVTSLFHLINQIDGHKQGVFNPIGRQYVNFIQGKILNIIADFFKHYELNTGQLEKSFLSPGHLKNWDHVQACIDYLIQRADSNHHDPLDLNGMNCLRSVYVSFYNISMLWLRKKHEVPDCLRSVLHVIPDKLNFSISVLKKEHFWERYQNHHFLFMKLPHDHREDFQKSIKQLTKKERVGWIGCLGLGEIENMVLPIAKIPIRFINLIESCDSVEESDTIYPMTLRVKGVIEKVYTKYLKENSSTPPEIHRLFKEQSQAGGGSDGDPEPEENIEIKGLEMIRNLRFMVVDDSDRIRQMTVSVLEKAGSRDILQAVDGQQAWQLLNTNDVNVVLCDWIMPNIDGLELLKLIKADEKMSSSITFIMLTTVNDKMSIVEALGLGARGYLIKPFSRKQLFEKVFFACEWLQKKQKKQI